ncbi:MAG: GH32 C-terminal domain-containing protein, partial [Acidobacteriota bacterium]
RQKPKALQTGDAFEIVAEFEAGKNSSAFIQLKSGSPEKETVIGYDADSGKLYVDRTQSGEVGFDRNFPGRHEAPLNVRQGKIKLHIFVDRSSVEVFGNDGEAAITDRIFPRSSIQRIELDGTGDNAKCLSLKVWQLKSIWKSLK